MLNDIIVVAEILNNSIRAITFELVALAEKLARSNSAGIKMVVISPNPESYAEEVSTKTGHDVIAVKTPLLEQYNGAAYKNILKKIVGDYNPLFICIGHTSQGIDFAPGLAVTLGCACITCVNGVTTKDNRDVFSRPIFGGKINAFIKSETAQTVLTVQPGVFINQQTPARPGNISHITTNDSPLKIQRTGIIKQESVPSHLNDAKSIIAIGRGIEDPDEISHAEKFSFFFTNAAVACSRPVVDMGWMKHKHQVGITGTVVAPDIYIACGISGSSQHIAGMNGAKFVIAINSDPNAAIFNFADICIVEDLLCFFESFRKNKDFKI